MKVIFSIRLTVLLLLAAVLLRPMHSQAQGVKDTISYSTSCVNTTISFGSSIFDRVFFPSSVKWHFGDPSSSYYDSSTAKQPRHIYASPGTYYISLTVVNNGIRTIMLDTLTIVPPMAYSFGSDIFLCAKQDTTLVAPNVPGAVYLWNDDSATTTPTLKVSKAGSYTVSINGCGLTDSIGVYYSDTPKLDLGKDHVMCDSANLTLNASAKNGQYTWLLDGSVMPDTTGQIVTHYPGGTYVAVVDIPGCGNFRDTVAITYASPIGPAFTLGPDTLLCPKATYRLAANLSGATAYEWSTSRSDPSIGISGPGTYWVFVTYQGLCQVTDTIKITYRGDHPLVFNDTALCKGSTLTLDADFGVGQYNWESIPAQRDDQNQTGQATYFVYKAGTYAVTATVGQCVYTDTLAVSFDDSLKMGKLRDTTLCNGEDFFLQANGNADSLLWQDGSTSASYKVQSSGLYTVIAKNACGKDTVQANINMVPCSCQLMLPNAFTPNGDGHNDVFRPVHVCEMGDFQMAIYDRWGEMVYNSSNPDLGWDGTYGGKKVMPGSFIWQVHYFNTITKQYVFKRGSVMLIR